jgi:hypothetical protein
VAESAADAKRGSKTWGPAGGTAGVCITCGAPARTSRAFYCAEHVPAKNHGRPVAPRETSTLLAAGAESESTPSDNGAAGEAYAEQTPREPKHAKKESTGLLGKFWSPGNKDKEPGSVAEKLGLPKTTERKPVVAKRRVSTADFWGDLVSPAAALSARAGYVPMARAMEWSSPVVGEIIEDATKGTLPDKLIQPIVRNSEKWADLFDLLGFWGAIGMAQRNPANAQGSLEFARKRLVNLLPRIAANIKKERAKERQAVEALVELMPDISELFPDMGPNDDPVALLIQSLFAAPETPAQEYAGAS